jgi:hypothetical protein
MFSEDPDLLVSHAECLLYVATSLIFKVSVSAEDARFTVSDKYISLMVIVFLQWDILSDM